MVREGVTTLILNPQSMNASAQTHAPAVLPQGKRLGIQGMGGWVVVREEDPDPSGNRTSVVQPAAIRYAANARLSGKLDFRPSSLIKTYSRYLLYPEDEGDTSFRNVGFYNTHTAPHPRRRHSS
jgi:hypothetical protein